MVFLYPIDQILIFVFLALSQSVATLQIASEDYLLLPQLEAVLLTKYDGDGEGERLLRVD